MGHRAPGERDATGLCHGHARASGAAMLVLNDAGRSGGTVDVARIRYVSEKESSRES